jgi:hypothetical protein
MAGIDSYVKLMLHLDGADESTTITDDSDSNHTMYVAGAGQIDTAQSKFGGASLIVSANGNYAYANDHADWDVGAGDWTVDFWVRFATVGDCTLISQNRDADHVNRLDFAAIYLGNLYVALSGNGNFGTAGYFYTAWSRSANTWYHVETARGGSTCYIFVDGVKKTVTQSTAFGTAINSDGKMKIGALLAAFSPLGWIDEVRFSKGICRHTDTFTPPTAAYSPDALTYTSPLPAYRRPT